MSIISIIEFPFNLGLREPFPGKEPGVKKAPEYLKRHGLHEIINPETIKTLAAPNYTMQMDPVSSVNNAEAIIEYARAQENLLSKEILRGNFPLVLGGDCSIIIGNALALRRKGKYALFYLDGHTDFMGVHLSESGSVAGMCAAIVAGYGHSKLTNIYGLCPYFNEEHVWCAGNREYDDEYINEIRRSKAKYVSLASLREEGISNCAETFLEMVEEQKLDGFWLHIDVDVLDDEVMPAVDSRTPGGLTYNEFNEIVYLLLSSPKAAGLEITILDPDLDPSGNYTKEFVRNFAQTFNKAKKRIL